MAELCPGLFAPVQEQCHWINSLASPRTVSQATGLCETPSLKKWG